VFKIALIREVHCLRIIAEEDEAWWGNVGLGR
jgi:hypothetical protein